MFALISFVVRCGHLANNFCCLSYFLLPQLFITHCVLYIMCSVTCSVRRMWMCNHVLATCVQATSPSVLNQVLCFCVEAAETLRRFAADFSVTAVWGASKEVAVFILLSLLSELVSVNEAYLALTVSTSALVGSGVSSSLCTHVFIFPFCLPLRIAILKAISLLWFYVKLCTTGKQVLGKQVKVLVFKVLSMGAAQPPSLKLGIFSVWGN